MAVALGKTSRYVRRPADKPEKMLHRGEANKPQPDQLWFLQVSQAPWQISSVDGVTSSRLMPSPRDPAELHNPDSEKHYFMVNAQGKNHVPRTAPTAPLEPHWGGGSTPRTQRAAAKAAGMPLQPVADTDASSVVDLPAPGDGEASLPASTSLLPSDYDAEANLSRIFPGRQKGGAAVDRPPSGGCTPRSGPSSAPGRKGGVPKGSPRHVVGGPLGPGRFERWGGGRVDHRRRAAPLADGVDDRGRLPMSSPSPTPPSDGVDAAGFDLATAAAAMGVVPALAPPAAQGGVAAAAGETPRAFQSAAVRLAVTVAEQLASAERAAQGRPSLRSCMTCLQLLDEIAPLLGPLQAVMERLTHALRLCVLSDRHYSRAVPPGGTVSRTQPLAYFELVGRLETRLEEASVERDDLRADVQIGESREARLEAQLAAAQAELRAQGEAMEALRLERTKHDAAIALHKHEVSVAEQKHEVLQAEAVAHHREHTQMLQALEEKVESLSTENEQLRAAMESRIQKEGAGV